MSLNLGYDPVEITKDVNSAMRTLGFYRSRCNAWKPDEEKTHDKLIEIIKSRFKQDLTENQMKKLHEIYTKRCNAVSRQTALVAKWIANRPWDKFFLRTSIQDVFIMCDRLIRKMKNLEQIQNETEF